MNDWALWITQALGAYALVGALFAAAFVTIGAGRIDPLAKAGTLGFRVLIFPGAAALWPLLALRWLRGGQPVERSAHRAAADAGSEGAR